MASTLNLLREASGRLVLVDAEGNRHAGVEAVRAFPITDPDHGVSIVDAHGHELAWIDDLDDLPNVSRALVCEELRSREFLPVICRIVSVAVDSDPSEWEVDTDRGPTRFLLNTEEDVRRLSPTRILITDTHGIRYLIADSRQLDHASRRMLDRYL